jgi:diguanylate cyclase (GGDEF)-like protein/PAS domain S-box-containing protein
LSEPFQRRFSLIRYKHSLWALPAFGAMLIAAVWVATWLQLQSTERGIIGAKTRAAGEFVASFERYTQRQIKDADRMAHIIRREFDQSGTLDLNRLAQAGLIEDTRLMVVSVADAKGNIVASSPSFGKTNIADLEYFRRHRDHDTDLVDISAPVIDRASGRSTLLLTRRMNQADGSFAGVVGLTVTPAFFTDFGNQADPRRQSSLGLVGLDGTFRARVVDGEPTSAPDGRGMRLVERAEASPVGHYEVRRDTDSAVRIVAYRKLADYPLIVSAAKPVDESLEDFNKNRSSSIIIASAATLAILLFFATVTTLAARLQRNRGELKVQRLFLKTIVDNVPDGIAVVSTQPSTLGQYILWNESNALIFGIRPDDALGRTVRDIMPSEYATRTMDLDRELLASPMVQDIEQVRELPDETRRTYRLIRAPIFGAAAQDDYIMTSATDIPADTAKTDELRLASKVFETTADAIVISDVDDRVVMVNAAFSKLTGFDAPAMVGKILDESPFRPIDVAEAHARDERLDRDGSVTAEVPRVHRDGTPLSLWLTASCVRNADGTIRNYVRVFTDISPLKETQRKLEQLASIDSLTGLPNRRLLHDRLEQAARRAQRGTEGIAVMFIDLDGLKKVNDTFGHDVGDLLLQEAASRLHECIRLGDSIGRLGGDEFAIVLEGARDQAAAAEIGERIVAAFAPPFILDGHRVTTAASVGIAVYPHDGRDAATLLKNADAAMYAAKRAGRNLFKFFSESAGVDG